MGLIKTGLILAGGYAAVKAVKKHRQERRDQPYPPQQQHPQSGPNNGHDNYYPQQNYQQQQEYGYQKYAHENRRPSFSSSPSHNGQRGIGSPAEWQQQQQQQQWPQEQGYISPSHNHYHHNSNSKNGYDNYSGNHGYGYDSKENWLPPYRPSSSNNSALGTRSMTTEKK